MILLHSDFQKSERDASQMELLTDRLQFGNGITRNRVPWDLMNSARTSSLNARSWMEELWSRRRASILFDFFLTPQIWGTISIRVTLPGREMHWC